jgi:hypothetical protein
MLHWPFAEREGDWSMQALGCVFAVLAGSLQRIGICVPECSVAQVLVEVPYQTPSLGC